MSLTRAAGGSDPIWSDNRAYPTTAIPSFRSPILPLHDHSSWSLTVSINVDLVAGGSVVIVWFADRAGRLVVGADTMADFATGGIDSGHALIFAGPCRGPFVRVVITPPSFTDGGDATIQADLVGHHLRLTQATWSTESGFSMPAAGGGDRVTIVDPRSGAAALAANVLNIAPAASSAALVTRPLLGGAYPGRVRIHFGTDGVTTLTTSGVANTEASATLRRQRGTAVAAAVSSYTVTAAKRLRLQGGHLVVAHSAAGAVWFAIRLTTAVTGTQAWYVCSRAQAAGQLVVPIEIPDGFEFDAGEILQFSTRATVASQPVELQLWGFEYDV